MLQRCPAGSAVHPGAMGASTKLAGAKSHEHDAFLSSSVHPGAASASEAHVMTARIFACARRYFMIVTAAFFICLSANVGYARGMPRTRSHERA
jgi:hypothetical protein